MSGPKTTNTNRKRQKIDLRLTQLILDLVKEHPEFSSQKLSQLLPMNQFGKPLLGNHGVQLILERFGLSTFKKRLLFAAGKLPIFVKSIEGKVKLTPQDRLELVGKVVKEGKSVSAVCRAYGISRPLFYRLKKRYQDALDYQKLEALTDKPKAPKRVAKKLSLEIEKQILEIVAEHPELSTLKVAQVLWPTVSKKGVHNLFKRNNLSTYERRLAWAESQKPEVIPVPIPTPGEEIGPPSRLRWLIAPFATIPKFVITHPITWPIAGPAFLFLFYIFEIDKFFRPTMFFPTIALTFGLIFFLYSVKYYFSLIMVLAYPGQVKEEGNERKEQGRVGKYWAKISGIFAKLEKAKLLAIQQDLDRVKLDRYPFVSVHIPLYNEKRVAERILRACQAFEYPNFEVIVVDDSTDETTAICQAAAGQDSRIRLIHRDERTGFKGGALQQALSQMNPATEYVCVFDADFIPFPDTLTNFVKTFQILHTSSRSGLEHSRIAAVQGYQWHVLNKSENWITRGIRTEYAGSYVVERAGIELYSGLKMIAGSVFCIRADVLRQFGWGTSITEDFQLTLKLYQAGFKVAYTPYIQAPSECVSTIRRLVKQRMRWAEGHTFNVRKMWSQLFASKNLTSPEKFEFLYLAPYYLQAAFFLVGTLSWFISEVIVHTTLPFWTAAFGWSLVFVNFLSLPLMNFAGLFLEESENRDYLGVASFVLLSYILVPFQAYAATKALFEKSEGPWFRTPKTGLITDVISRARFYQWFEKLRIFPKPAFQPHTSSRSGLEHSWEGVSSFNPLTGYKLKPRRISLVSRSVIAGLLVVVILVNYLAFFTPTTSASNTQAKLEQQINIHNDPITTISTSFTPTDNSVGLVAWDSTKYDSDTVYFEAVIQGSSNDRGQYTSIYCISSTNCKIAYYDVTYADLLFVQCTAADCSTSADAVALDTTGDVGQNASIYCPADDDCKISYVDLTNNDLKFYDCGNVACSTGSASVADSAVSIGDARTSIYCPTATNCKVAYWNNADVQLRFRDCDNATCTTGSSRNIDTGGESGTDRMIFCPTSDDCKIAYVATDDIIKVADCNNETCSAPVLSTITDAFNISPSLYCPTAGNCKIAYIDRHIAREDLIFYDCDDVDCLPGTEVTVESANSVGFYTSIDCRAGAGDCKISHQDRTNFDLRFYDCDNETCSTGSGNAVDTAGNVGSYTSLFCFSTSNDCKISYHDETNGKLKFAQCTGTDTDCTTKSTRTIGNSTATAGLFTSGGTQVTCGAANVEVSTTNITYTRVRTTCDLAGMAAGNYTIRLKSSGTGVSANAARLIILQSAAGPKLTDTRTQIEIGDREGITSTSYVVLTDDKHYCFNSDSTVTACAAASPTNWSPAPTVNFSATLKSTASDTAFVELFNFTDSTQAAEVSTTSTSYTLVTDTTVTLTAGKQYKVRIRCSDDGGGGCTANIANAKIILDQSDSVNGISDLETVQQYANSNVGGGTTTSYNVDLGFDNQFNDDNFFGNSIEYHFEATMFEFAEGKCTEGTVFAVLYNETDGVTINNASPPSSEISTTVNNSETRIRSANIASDMPTIAKELSHRRKMSGSCESIQNNSWLIIRISQLGVPELIGFLLPFAPTIPFIIRRLQNKKNRKRTVIDSQWKND